MADLSVNGWQCEMFVQRLEAFWTATGVICSLKASSMMHVAVDRSGVI